MLVMTDRGIDPASDKTGIKTLGIQFPAQVAIDIVQYRQEKEEDDMGSVYRDRKDKNSKYPYLYNSLQRMKGICRPGRGIGRLMMHQMKITEQTRMMHKPMRPIK